MNAFARIFSRIKALFNRYEAAQPSTPQRSWVPAFVRDARFDANSFTRWELTRKIRYFERNVWLVQKLREQFVKYTVGPNGLQVIPASSDAKWNAAALEAYQQWCQQPALDSLLPMGQIHKLIAGETHIDGEIFILKTFSKPGGKGQAVPRIQLIESHRVSSPGSMFSNADNPNQVDGVEIDSNGMPIRYWIVDGFEPNAWTARDAAQIIHVGEPTRAGMYRYLTPYYATLNTLHDLDDLEIMEMERAKEASSISNVVQTWNGELDPATLKSRRYLNPQNSTNAAVNAAVGNTDLDKRIEQYRTILGSRTIGLKPGEEIKQFSSNQPSAATQWYWKFKISQVCSAIGVPMILVLPESIQGTVARGIYDDANLFFRSKFCVFAHSAREMYLHFIDWARYNVPTLYDAPGDWNKCHITPPRSVNVDVGRNSIAQLAELAAGTTSFDEIYGAGGSSAEVGLRKKGANIVLIKQIAKELSKDGITVEPAEISAPLADIISKLAMANQADALAKSQETIDEKEPVEA